MKITAVLNIEGESSEVSAILRLVQEYQDGQIKPGEAFYADDEAWREAPSTGWTLDLVRRLRKELNDGGASVQLAAFDAAVENGGHISRAEVYKLGKYATDRKLNNWTARFRKIMDTIVAEGSLPEDADAPIEPDYGLGSGYRPAVGFNVAPEIVKLMRS